MFTPLQLTIQAHHTPLVIAYLQLGIASLNDGTYFSRRVLSHANLQISHVSLDLLDDNRNRYCQLTFFFSSSFPSYALALSSVEIRSRRGTICVSSRTDDTLTFMVSCCLSFPCSTAQRRSELDWDTSRRAYVLSIVERTASSLWRPLMMRLITGSEPKFASSER